MGFGRVPHGNNGNSAKIAAKRTKPPASPHAKQLPKQRSAKPAPRQAVCAVIASPLLSCAQHASDSEVSIAESVVCVPIPQVRVPISRGMRATSGGACAPLGFGRENERVSETRPSEKPDPQRSQAGAHNLDQFFAPSS